MTSPIGPPAEHVLQEEVGDDVVLYDSQRHRFYELNETASDVWRLSTGEFTPEEIVAKLAEAYQAEATSIRGDVTSILERFTAAGLFGEAAQAAAASVGGEAGAASSEESGSVSSAG